MKKRIFSLLMALTVIMTVFNISFNAFAADTDTPVDEEIIEEYTVIASNTAAIRISGVTAYCSASLTSSYTTSISVKMELQKKSSGSYSTIKTWSSSKTGYSINLSGTKAINVLSSYRLKVTFKAGNETVTYYKYPS